MSEKPSQDQIAKAANALYDNPTLRGHSVVEITRIAVTALDAAQSGEDTDGSDTKAGA